MTHRRQALGLKRNTAKPEDPIRPPLTPTDMVWHPFEIATHHRPASLCETSSNAPPPRSVAHSEPWTWGIPGSSGPVRHNCGNACSSSSQPADAVAVQDPASCRSFASSSPRPCAAWLETAKRTPPSLLQRAQEEHLHQNFPHQVHHKDSKCLPCHLHSLHRGSLQPKPLCSCSCGG